MRKAGATCCWCNNIEWCSAGESHLCREVIHQPYVILQYECWQLRLAAAVRGDERLIIRGLAADVGVALHAAAGDMHLRQAAGRQAGCRLGDSTSQQAQAIS
jgi:hypothetical protein